MKSLRKLSRPGACIVVALLVGGASLPSALTGSGEWEISKSASGTDGEKACLTDPALLMQWEHRTKQCTRVIITSSVDRAEVHYTCTGGGFGTSRVEMLTPRSVKIEAQGISDGYPYAFTLHARRVGACQSH